MTRKDFQLIADTLNKKYNQQKQAKEVYAYEQNSEATNKFAQREAVLQELITEFTDVLVGTNDLFKANRFKDACFKPRP